MLLSLLALAFLRILDFLFSFVPSSSQKYSAAFYYSRVRGLLKIINDELPPYENDDSKEMIAAQEKLVADARETLTTVTVVLVSMCVFLVSPHTALFQDEFAKEVDLLEFLSRYPRAGNVKKLLLVDDMSDEEEDEPEIEAD